MSYERYGEDENIFKHSLFIRGYALGVCFKMACMLTSPQKIDFSCQEEFFGAMSKLCFKFSS